MTVVSLAAGRPIGWHHGWWVRGAPTRAAFAIGIQREETFRRLGSLWHGQITMLTAGGSSLDFSWPLFSRGSPTSSFSFFLFVTCNGRGRHFSMVSNPIVYSTQHSPSDPSPRRMQACTTTLLLFSQKNSLVPYLPGRHKNMISNGRFDIILLQKHAKVVFLETLKSHRVDVLHREPAYLFLFV